MTTPKGRPVTDQDAMTPDEVWERLGEIQYEIDTTEVDAERLEDADMFATAERLHRRVIELREEFAAYATKHGLQLNERGDVVDEEAHR